MECKKSQDMGQCLRCSKPCATTSIFCDGCRTLLRSQLQQDGQAGSSESVVMSPVVARSAGCDESELRVNGNPLERITSSYPIVQAPQTPSQEPYPDIVEQAVHKLTEAAQFIHKTCSDTPCGGQGDSGGPRLPHASRLAPIRDITADIRRESTPLPLTPRAPESEQGEDLGERLPDLWPWLQDAEPDESDSWDNGTDPLMARHFPDSAESARIEEEDMRRAIASGMATSSIRLQRSRSKYLRIAFICLAILAVLALAVDGVLASVAFTHPHRNNNALGGPPTITLSSAQVSVGQTVILHIRRFSPSALVSLTHDIQEPIQTSRGSSIVKVGPDGAADISILVDVSWGPGPHTVEAEDFTTRYTASIILQIVRDGQMRPAHLVIDTHLLEMGADYQGANTIQSVTLLNGGGGSISWTASSNQPWLMLSPVQGLFSARQTVAVAVDRANLKPGDYKGTLSFASNVGMVEHADVEMSVHALPPHVGAVLEVTPPVLSFMALDGAPDPDVQVLTISNPGSQTLHWSLAINTSNAGASATGLNWLTTNHTSGDVVPGSTDFVQVSVNSQIMLPGTYTNTLVFTGDNGVFNSPQNVSISLTVEPSCALALSTGGMTFTAVSGQSNPSNQSLIVGATTSCTGTISWRATSSASWLTVTPASGQVKTPATATSVVAVNTSGLVPGTYTGNISFLTGESTQTVVVQLTVQAPPPPSAPIMGVLPLILNFSTTQGVQNTQHQSQMVTITNNGGSPLNWHTSVATLKTLWVTAAPSGGVIPPGKTGQLTVNVNTAGLTPGTYSGQISLIGTDNNGSVASGSPQMVSVNLLVLPPCTLAQPSSSSLAFSATQGSKDPTAQTITITGSGNCGWPLNWKANVTSPTSWLKLSPASGLLLSANQSATLNVAASIAGLPPGTYTTQVSLTAIDGSGSQPQGSPQNFAVTLTVLQPCTLALSSSRLAFTVPEGQSPSAGFTVSEVSTCARPVSWTIATDGSSWLNISPTTGTDNGVVNVSVNTTNLALGNYTSYITISASGNGGAFVQGSPQTIPVKLIVTGFTVSGTVMICVDKTCANPTALLGATLVLSTSGSQFPPITADGSGNFSFSNLPLGTYTVNASGTNAQGIHYVGTATITVAGNQSGIIIDVYPG